MRLKSYNILFHLLSFLSDKTNGAPFFVKYKLLLGMLIIGMITSAKAQEKDNERDTTSFQQVSVTPTKQNIRGEIEISGNVKDDTGPLMGATVRIKNSSQGVAADFDGNFQIKAKANDILVFSFIGCETQEIRVSKIKNGKVDVVLKQDGVILCYEVVISVRKRKPKQAKVTVKRQVSNRKNQRLN